jgi:3-oxoacyl-[acyl-carrier-protein] synthase II
MIQRGEAEIMICGGSEAAVMPLSVAGFSAMRALSTRNDDPETASRPWDCKRDGFVPGEGAGVLILEEREYALLRGTKVLADLVGYAANSDAFHPNAPPEDTCCTASSFRSGGEWTFQSDPTGGEVHI